MKRNNKFVVIQKDIIQQVVDGKLIEGKFQIPFDELKNRTEVVSLIEQFRKEGAQSSAVETDDLIKDPWDRVVHHILNLTDKELADLLG